MRQSHVRRARVPDSDRVKAGTGGDQIKITELVSQSELVPLRDAWNESGAQTPGLGVFAQFDWFDAIWPWSCQLGKPFVLRVEVAGTTVGLVPLMIRRRGRHYWRYSELTLLTVPDTQFCDVLAAPRWHDTVISSLTDWLVRSSSRWSRLRFSRIPEGSPTLSALANALRARGVNAKVSMGGLNRAVELSDRWEDYYGTRSRRLKKGNNLIANRLSRAGEVKIEWLRGQQIDDDAASNLIRLSAQSWKQHTGTTLDHKGPGSFLQRLLEHGRAAGWLSVWLLRLDGIVIATELQIIHGGTVHALRAEYLEEYGELSPGTYLNWQVLAGLFGQGLERYFMGPGDNPYKSRWAETGTRLGQVTAYSPTFRGRLLQALELGIQPRLRRLVALTRPSAAQD